MQTLWFCTKSGCGVFVLELSNAMDGFHRNLVGHDTSAVFTYGGV